VESSSLSGSTKPGKEGSTPSAFSIRGGVVYREETRRYGDVVQREDNRLAVCESEFDSRHLHNGVTNTTTLVCITGVDVVIVQDGERGLNAV
jgi:hypothetical protein